MPVLYTLRKNNNSNSKGYGKWYAKATMIGVIETDGLANIIQRNCSMKKSDVLAVLSELVEVMQDELQSSKRVKLNGFGSFKIGLTSAGADKASDFDVRKQIKGLHVCFTPEAKTDSAGTRRKTFLIGATVQEAPKNAVDKSEDEEAETQEP